MGSPNTTSKAKMEFSAGGVIYRRAKNRIEVCLIATHGGQIWQLPKGLTEKGEPVEEAAAREVCEETGLAGMVLQRIDKINYWYVDKYRQPPQRIHKTVYFCLIQYTKGSVEDHDREVDAAQWFPIEEALSRLQYSTERKILEQAIDLLK